MDKKELNEISKDNKDPLYLYVPSLEEMMWAGYTGRGEGMGEVTVCARCCRNMKM